MHPIPNVHHKLSPAELFREIVQIEGRNTVNVGNAFVVKEAMKMTF